MRYYMPNAPVATNPTTPRQAGRKLGSALAQALLPLLGAPALPVWQATSGATYLGQALAGQRPAGRP